MPIINGSQVPVQFGKVKKGDGDCCGETKTRMKIIIINGESKRQCMYAKSS